MSITRENPRVIHLGGPITLVGDKVAAGTITPGMLVEGDGTGKYKAHATAGGFASPSVALDQSMLNRGPDDNYAADDTMEVGVGASGSTFHMLIPSGQNITVDGILESAGNGKLRAFSSGVKLFKALESVNNTTGGAAISGNAAGDARIRVEVLS